MASLAYFLSLGTLAVSLFAWFSTSSTFSWFASNKETDATGMAISIKGDDDVSIEAHYFRYVEIETEDESGEMKGTGVYHVQKDPLDKLSLTRYDQIFTDDNKYAPLLIQLTLTGGKYESGTDILPLKILHDDHYDKKVSWTLDGDDTDNFDIGETDTTYHLSSYLSSVVSIKAIVDNDSTLFTQAEVDALETNTSALEDDFETLRTEFASLTGKRFVDSIPDAGAATKTDIDFSEDTNLTYQESMTESGTKTCTVYVWIDYDTTQEVYDGGSSNYGLINAYIDQMKAKLTTVDAGYPLGSDITELTIIKNSSSN